MRSDARALVARPCDFGVAEIDVGVTEIDLGLQKVVLGLQKVILGSQKLILGLQKLILRLQKLILGLQGINFDRSNAGGQCGRGKDGGWSHYAGWPNATSCCHGIPSAYEM